MSASDEVLIKMGVDASTIGAGMRKVSELVKNSPVGGALLSVLTSPIGLATTALTAFATKVAFTFHDLQDRAKEIKMGASLANISTEQYEPWMLAAKGAGVGTEAIAKSIAHIAEAMEAVKKGGEGGAAKLEAFNKLGIGLKDISKGDAFSVWQRVGNNLHVTKLNADELTSGLELMGKSFEEVQEIFKRGTGNPLDQMKSIGGADQKALLDMAREKKIRDAIVGAMWENVVTSGMEAISGRPTTGAGKTTSALIPLPLRLAMAAYRKMSGADSLGESLDRDAAAKQAQEKVNPDLVRKALAESEARKKQLAEQERIAKEHPEAARLVAQALEMEEKHSAKLLPINQEIAKLSLQRKHLQDEMADTQRTELEQARTRNELAKVQLDLDTRIADKANLMKEIGEARKKVGKLEQSRDKAEMSEFMPTIHELTGSRDWNTRSLANRIEWLQGDAKASILNYGANGRQGEDIKEINRLKGILRDSGFISADDHLADMDDNISDAKDHLAELLKTFTTGNAKFTPVNGGTTR